MSGSDEIPSKMTKVLKNNSEDYSPFVHGSLTVAPDGTKILNLKKLLASPEGLKKFSKVTTETKSSPKK